MSEAHPPIPAPLWDALKGFLQRQATGSLTLHVVAGVITSAEIQERLAAPKAPRP